MSDADLLEDLDTLVKLVLIKLHQLNDDQLDALMFHADIEYRERNPITIDEYPSKL